MNFNISTQDARLASLPGEPAIMCWDADRNIYVQICPNPLVGLDATGTNSLCYPVIVLTPDNMPAADVSNVIAAALDTLDMSSLNDVLAEQDSEDIDFRIYVDVEATPHSAVYIHHALACVSATVEHIQKVVVLCNKQSEVLARYTSLEAEAQGTLQ